MTIALAHSALGEIPIARLALITLPAVCIRHTLALAGYQVAVFILRSDAVAIASLATFGTKTIGARSTLIALPAHHIGLTLAVTSIGFAHLAQRSGWIAITHTGSIVDKHTEDIVQILTFRIRLVVHIVQRGFAIVFFVILFANISQNGSLEDGRYIDAGNERKRIHQDRRCGTVHIVSLSLKVNPEFINLSSFQAYFIQSNHLTAAIRKENGILVSEEVAAASSPHPPSGST